MTVQRMLLDDEMMAKGTTDGELERSLTTVRIKNCIAKGTQVVELVVSSYL